MSSTQGLLCQPKSPPPDPQICFLRAPGDPAQSRQGACVPPCSWGPGLGLCSLEVAPESPVRGSPSLCRPRPWPELAWTREGCWCRWLTCRIQPHQQAWCLPLALPGPLGRPVQATISTSHWPEAVGGRNHNWANPGSFSGALSPGQVTRPSGPGFLASNNRRITLPFLPPTPTPPPEHTFLQASRAGPRAAQPLSTLPSGLPAGTGFTLPEPDQPLPQSCRARPSRVPGREEA